MSKNSRKSYPKKRTSTLIKSKKRHTVDKDNSDPTDHLFIQQSLHSSSVMNQDANLHHDKGDSGSISSFPRSGSSSSSFSSASSPPRSSSSPSAQHKNDDYGHQGSSTDAYEHSNLTVPYSLLESFNSVSVPFNFNHEFKFNPINCSTPKFNTKATATGLSRIPGAPNKRPFNPDKSNLGILFPAGCGTHIGLPPVDAPLDYSTKSISAPTEISAITKENPKSKLSVSRKRPSKANELGQTVSPIINLEHETGEAENKENDSTTRTNNDAEKKAKLGKDDPKYKEHREKNNISARKSREARKAKIKEMEIRSSFLERENAQLKHGCLILEGQINAMLTLLGIQANNPLLTPSSD